MQIICVSAVRLVRVAVETCSRSCCDLRIQTNEVLHLVLLLMDLFEYRAVKETTTVPFNSRETVLHVQELKVKKLKCILSLLFLQMLCSVLISTKLT